MKKRKISISILRNKSEKNLLKVVPFHKKDKAVAKQFTRILRKLNQDAELKDYLLKMYNDSISMDMPFED